MPDSEGEEWEWTLTNIGAVIVMAALVLAVMTVGIMILYAIIYTILAIPIAR